MSIQCTQCASVPHVTPHEVEAHDPEVLRDLFTSQMRGYVVRQLYDRRQELSVEVAILKEMAEQQKRALKLPTVKADTTYTAFRPITYQERRVTYTERANPVQALRAKTSARLARRQAEKRRGYVYVLKTFAGLYKIGQTRDLTTRLESFAALGKGAFECVHVIKSENSYRAEQRLHGFLAASRVERELFNLTDEQVAWLQTLESY